ncbi:hypothetical protein JAAARDRAFT_67527 [Jaapia argillacea MUCL 33604]|uniref:tRNA(Ile)-lysidine synthetase n=1 Tax=Jaapia argillacea MUCL 33604 TaxID=933084 RepID=A0A067Q4P2_9AGAM|nr:hypothetical protein JAAARDRAFT_67527 [Jaapia argillacea MUCL 33604]
MGVISAITPGEFFPLLQRCKPLRGWPRKLAVANSGGPDSTCLLHLLRCILLQPGTHPELPEILISVTVDHGLQAVSSSMAEHTENLAKSLGVEHLTQKIVWSQPPFPAKPTEAFESIARDARYHSIFQAMSSVGANAVAFGHHADDQVETALIRLMNGSGVTGAAGMRHCRRWGMGFGNGEGSLGWAGYEGMNRWIVRPLLGISKSRILATCEANGLQYVNDPTNFQPEITLRNAIRQFLTSEYAESNAVNAASPMKPLSPALAGSAAKIGSATSFLRTYQPSYCAGSDGLRAAVHQLSARMDSIEDQVSENLLRRSVPSPPSTFLFHSTRLSSISENSVRLGMVLRTLRYVSPYPWGSPRAEAHRRSKSLQQIVDKVWNASLLDAKPFVAGGAVVWAPVLISNTGRFIMLDQKRGRLNPELSLGWLASRQAPALKSIAGYNTTPTPLCMDVTDLLVQRIGKATAPSAQDDFVDVLYDCRFLIRFSTRRIVDLLQIPTTETAIPSRVVIEPETRWYLPKIVWKRAGLEDQVLARLVGWWRKDGVEEPKESPVEIEIDSIRTIDAL